MSVLKIIGRILHAAVKAVAFALWLMLTVLATCVSVNSAFEFH